MKRYAVHAAIVALAAVLLLGSCDALFTNYFKAAGLGQVGTDRVANVVNNPSATDDEVIAAIRTSITSDSFYASLAADSTLKTALENRLSSIANAAVLANAVMTENIQIAFNTLVDIKVQTTRGMELVRNFGSLLGTYMKAMPKATARADDSTTVEIRQKIEALIPPDISQDDLAAAVDGIADSWQYFVDMATVMRNPGSTGFIGMTDDEIMSTIQIAVLAALFDAFSPHYPPYATIGTAFAAAWFDYKNGSGQNISVYIDTTALPDLDTIFDSNGVYYQTFTTLLQAAGLEVSDLEDLVN